MRRVRVWKKLATAPSEDNYPHYRSAFPTEVHQSSRTRIPTCTWRVSLRQQIHGPAQQMEGGILHQREG